MVSKSRKKTPSSNNESNGSKKTDSNNPSTLEML